jgi:hypothetical protein
VADRHPTRPGSDLSRQRQAGGTTSIFGKSSRVGAMFFRSSENPKEEVRSHQKVFADRLMADSDGYAKTLIMLPWQYVAQAILNITPSSNAVKQIGGNKWRHQNLYLSILGFIPYFSIDCLTLWR